MAATGCGDSEEAAQLQLGKAIFTEISQPTCATCHTLKDAGATGIIGPDMDKLKPDIQRVITAVTHGVGIMPAQQEVLTELQIQAVAFYVAHATQ